MHCLLILALLILSVPAYAQDENQSLVIDLASDHVDITSSFSGAHLNLFGVKKQPGDIAIVIKGPRKRTVVRHKDKVMGIWMNRETVTFEDVPVYYDFALSTLATNLAAPDILAEYGITLDTMQFVPRKEDDTDTITRFREALVRNKQTQGLFPLEPKKVIFLSDDFFRADFYVPPDLPKGDYTIETYLFNDGKLKTTHDTLLTVAQVGMNADINRFAHERRIVYGLTTVLLAFIAGGAAYLLMRK